MTVDADSIRADFEEFSDLTDAQIDPKIADAVAIVSVSTWGTLVDQGVKYLTAHLIAMSPLGEQAKLDLDEDDEDATVYLQHYKRLMRQLAAACRVI